MEQEYFNRFILQIGEEKYHELSNKTVLIIGLGGVGGYTAESLARSGIKHLILVDNDRLDITNINRQIISLNSNIGNFKVIEFQKRIKDINPGCEVTIINEFIDKDNIDKLFNYHIDYLVDACDTLETKKLLIKNAVIKKIKIISVMGMGNKIDPTKIQITSLDKTSYDPLAKKLRKFLHEERISEKIMVVYSKEEVTIKDKVITSNSYLPAIAGLYCTYYIINDIIC